MEGVLEVDGHQEFIGRSQGAFTQLTVTQDMYIGGHRNFEETSKHANVSVSLEGCVQKVHTYFVALCKGCLLKVYQWKALIVVLMIV